MYIKETSTVKTNWLLVCQSLVPILAKKLSIKSAFSKSMAARLPSSLFESPTQFLLTRFVASLIKFQ